MRSFQTTESFVLEISDKKNPFSLELYSLNAFSNIRKELLHLVVYEKNGHDYYLSKNPKLLEDLKSFVPLHRYFKVAFTRGKSRKISNESMLKCMSSVIDSDLLF